MQQSCPLSVKGSFVIFVLTADHMHLTHMVFICVNICRQCHLLLVPRLQHATKHHPHAICSHPNTSHHQMRHGCSTDQSPFMFLSVPVVLLVNQPSPLSSQPSTVQQRSVAFEWYPTSHTSKNGFLQSQASRPFWTLIRSIAIADSRVPLCGMLRMTSPVSPQAI